MKRTEVLPDHGKADHAVIPRYWYQPTYLRGRPLSDRWIFVPRHCRKIDKRLQPFRLISQPRSGLGFPSKAESGH